MQISLQLHDKLLNIAHRIQECGGSIYLVGGSVRDAILGQQEPKDFDLEVHDLPEEKLASILAEFGRVNSVGKSFGILLMRIKGVQYDFALPRTERKIDAGHKGFAIQTDPYLSFKEAASRRDFTINAMGLKLPEMKLEDPWGGFQDLQRSCLRHVGPAFSEDPLRALRAVQFAARFHLHIHPETAEMCRIQDLSELSIERFEEEFRKLLLKSQRPSLGLALMVEMDLTRYFPELHPSCWRWDQKIVYGAIDQMAAWTQEIEDENERLVALHSTIANAMPREIVDSWLGRFTNDRKLVEGVLLRWNGDGELRASFADGDPHQGLLRRLALPYDLQWRCLLTQAFDGQAWTQRVRPLAEMFQCWTQKPSPWIQGRDLLQMGHQPGASFGYWLKKTFDKQLDGDFKDASEARAWLEFNYRQEPEALNQ